MLHVESRGGSEGVEIEIASGGFWGETTIANSHVGVHVCLLILSLILRLRTT